MEHQQDRVRLDYRLTFEAAFRFGSGLPRLLIDRSVHRDAKKFLYVPGSTLKGVLRDRCEQIARLFGGNEDDDARLDPPSPHDTTRAREEYDRPNLLTYLFGSKLLAGGLYFDDARMSRDDRTDFVKDGRDYRDWQTTERTQVSLSRQSGTARANLLFSSEFGIRDLRFEGRISGYVRQLPLDTGADGPPTYPLLLLLAGLLSLDRLGGNKSSGAGRTQVEVTRFEVNGIAVDIDYWLDHLEWLELWHPDTAS